MSSLTSGLSLSKRSVALALAASIVAWAILPAASLFASSHREAPLTSQDAPTDGTDFYMFLSPSDATKIVFVANSYPFHYPEGGPNYFRFADNAVYAVHIDTNGDAKEDVTYAFKFTTQVGNGNTFLFNTQPIVDLDDANVRQLWKAYRIKGVFTGSNSQLKQANVVASGEIATPVIGSTSQADYAALAAKAIVNAGAKGKFFAGERDDPFFVDLKVFDLLNLGSGDDSVRGANVNSIIFEVPVRSLVGKDPIIGAWSANYRPAQRVLNTSGVESNSTTWVQVSRLGMPLVNEVVVPLAAKDYFNASKPVDDAGTNFNAYSAVVLTPELAGLLKNVLNLDFDGNGTANVPTTNRTDLVTVFLTGVDGLNKPANVRAAEMLRINTTTPLAQNPNRLGVFGGDNAGFPNGRRLADDVTDIAIQAVAGKLVQGFTVPSTLGDGVDTNDKAFTNTFPYVATPHLTK
jgi:hypothetical protein